MTEWRGKGALSRRICYGNSIAGLAIALAIHSFDLVIHSLDLFVRLISAREFGVMRLSVQLNGCTLLRSLAERRVSHAGYGADSPCTGMGDGNS